MTLPRFTQLATAAVLSTFALGLSPAWAGEGQITMNIVKAAAVVGVSGGGGVLTFDGVDIPLVVSGLSIGASVALVDVTLTGAVKNIEVPTDIEGSYTAVGAGAALVLGAGASLTFENDAGTRLDVVAAEVGFDLSLDLTEFVIAIE